MKFTIYHAQPVLDLIGRYESRGDYEIVYGGIPKAQRPQKLTAMTIAKVISWQRQVVATGADSSAAGKYQIIRKTLEASVAALKMSMDRLFDKTTQDELAVHLLASRGMQRFLNGQIDSDDMALGLAREWASLPVPTDMMGQTRRIKAGQSYYAGDGLNKAHATVAEVDQALNLARERYRSGAKPAPRVPVSDATTATGQGVIAGLIAAFFKLIGGRK